MKNKLLYTFILVFCATFTFAQTKLIHHKSHSGNAENFAVSVEKNLFDIGESNFGVAPTMIVKTAELDSLIYLSDTSTIMVTKEICRDEYRPKADPTIWKAGRDTIYNHALFTLKYELDSIKKTLDELYNFQNKVKDMTFVGYANERPTQKNMPSQNLNKISKKDLKKLKKNAKKKQRAKMEATKKKKQQEESQDMTVAPIMIENMPPPPSPPASLVHSSTLFLVGMIGLLSLLTGVIFWKFNAKAMGDGQTC